MKMLIDNHIEILKSYHNGFTGCVGNLQESIDVAVDIMNKYQRIQEIVKAWKADVDINSYDCMADICEVIEDGNDDC